MTSLATPVIGADQSAAPLPSSPSNPDADALDKVRQTARTIQDRIRRVLIPQGSAVPTLRVLVVDDIPDAADSLASVLELLGCSVQVSYDGWSALAAADEFKPQICLLDLKMPGMNGLELGERLKTWAGSQPLVLIATTAMGDDETRQRATSVGFHAHLTKPVDIANLIEEMNRIWNILRG